MKLLGGKPQLLGLPGMQLLPENHNKVVQP